MSDYGRWFVQVFLTTLGILSAGCSVWLIIRAGRKKAGASLPTLTPVNFLLSFALMGDVLMTLILTLFERSYTISAVQLVPFTGLIERHYTLFFLNIWVFVPFGVLMFLRFSHLRRVTTITALSFTFSLTIELLQLLFRRGVFDVDDLICNTAGGFIGALLAALFLRIHNSISRR